MRGYWENFESKDDQNHDRIEEVVMKIMIVMVRMVIFMIRMVIIMIQMMKRIE